MIDTTQIAHLVEHQFPEFYKQQGPNFIAFVRAYYEWLELSGNTVNSSRRMAEYVDIDHTPEQYLKYFKYEYMHNLPSEIIGNQRLFQKHILELYRSKGSLAGLKLLFRLLYNEDVDVYIPSYDIFKGSDGEWIIPTYLEVTDSSILPQYRGKVITGVSSGASAIVESVESKVLEDGTYNVVYISNIYGSFSKGEQIIADGITFDQAVQIKGSPTTAKSLTSTAHFNVGDVLVDSTPDRSQLVQFVVKEVYDSTGIIEFDIVDGGDLYSVDAEVTITAGSNTTGIGADFRVFSISNTSVFTYSTDIIQTYASKAIQANTYGFPYNPSANLSSTIDNAINFVTTNVGTIERLAVLNPGTGYDGSVTISVVDPYTTSRGIWVGDSFGGNNALITGTSLTGVGLIGAVDIYDSGIRNNTDNMITSVVSTSNNQLTATLLYNTDAVGKSPGYFNDTKGFASDDKYLTDGHYYQDFSYVIKSGHQLDDYVEILRNTVHVAGNRPFGQVILNSTTTNNLQVITSSLTQS